MFCLQRKTRSSCSSEEFQRTWTLSWCVQQKEDSGYRRRKWAKNERQENPVGFKSSSTYIQDHNVELTSPTVHQREGGNHGQVVQEGLQDVPWEGNNAEGSCTCTKATTGLQMCVMRLQLPNGSSLFCDVNPIGSFHESDLFHGAMQAPKQMQLLQVSLTGATLKPKECVRTKERATSVWTKTTLGLLWFCFSANRGELHCKGVWVVFWLPTSGLQHRASSPERCKMRSMDHKWGCPGLYPPESSVCSGPEECCV